MKQSFLLAALIVSISMPSDSWARLEIDRIWTQDGFAYALVTYINESDKTFNKAVTVQCVALDESGLKLDMNERSFFAYERGPIKPGFTGTLRVPVELRGGIFKSMTCEVREW